MEIYTIIILLILNIYFVIRGFKLVSIIEDLQSEIIEKDDDVYKTLNGMLEEMRSIDLRGAFESDDEVGSVFKELKDIIEEYNQKLYG